MGTANSTPVKTHFDMGMWPTLAVSHVNGRAGSLKMVGDLRDLIDVKKEAEDVGVGKEQPGMVVEEPYSLGEGGDVEEEALGDLMDEFVVLDKQTKDKEGIVLVEFHQSESWNEIHYSVGQVFHGGQDIIADAHIKIGNTIPQENEGDKVGVCMRKSCMFCIGIQPAVALSSSGHVVEVHRANLSNTLFYTVGKVNRSNSVASLDKRNKGGIIWGETTRFDAGSWPTVAMNNRGLVVATYHLEINDSLFYRVGILQTSDFKVDWKKATKYAFGSNPNIQINDNNMVVEVHKTKDEQTSCYRIGKVTPQGELNWLCRSTKYCRGVFPNIALHPTLNTVYEVHRKQYFFSKEDQERAVEGENIDPPPVDIFSQKGTIVPAEEDRMTIQWGTATKIQTGHFASVACCQKIQESGIAGEDVLLTVHQKNEKLTLSSPNSTLGVSLVSDVV